MRSIFLILLAVFSGTIVYGQAENNEYKKLILSDQNDVFSSIALNPTDNALIAIHGMQACPLFIYNWKEEKVLHEFKIANWKAGSAMSYSPNGKYLLLEKLFFNNWAPNKDKKTEFHVYDSNTGKLIFKLEDYNAVKFMPTSEKIIALTGSMLEIWDITANKKIASKNIANAGNCAASSPDGKLIAISGKYDKKELKKSGKFKKNKDGLKHTAKTKNKIAIYNAETLELERTIDSYFDFIYDLSFSENGEELFCLQIPHTKASTGHDRRQNTISIVLTKDWQPIRKGFVSRALSQPEYGLTGDRKFFGLISNGGNSAGGFSFAELHIYDYEAGKLFNRFELSHRLIEREAGRLVRTDDKSRFVFLPDNKTAIMTFGNALVKWTFVK